MKICVDIGNSTIAFGVFEKSSIVSFFKVKKDEIEESNIALSHIKAELSFRKIDINFVDSIYISSVVPSATDKIKNILKSIFSCNIEILTLCSSNLIVDDSVNPELGCDIYANSVAARYKHPDRDLIVVDFGTASTIVGIDRHGRIKGVSIAAGVFTSLAAICNRAEQLNSIVLDKCSLSLGTNTKDAITSGVLFSAIGMIECCVQRVSSLFETKPFVVATGGAMHFVSSNTDYIDEEDEYNTVFGILKCFEK